MKKASKLLIFVATLSLLAPVLAGASEDVSEKVARLYQKANDGNYLLTVHRSLAAANHDFFRNLFIYFGGFNFLESFNVPEDVDLRTRIFSTQEDLNHYVLNQYLTSFLAAKDVVAPAQPTKQVCSLGEERPNPEILSVLPVSGQASTPVILGGLDFGQGAVPYFNGLAGLPLFNFSMQNIPLIGSVSVGFTLVPSALPATTTDLTLNYCGRFSNPVPFEVQE